MASVVRIKRRRTDDPADALILSHKKSRTTDPNDLDVESVLEFAGTLASKDDPVSKHIKDAIRQKKIHKEMHPHSSDFKMTHVADKSKLRKQKVEASHNNRYRITCSRRALDIDNLDHNSKGENKNETEGALSQNTPQDKHLLNCSQLSDENKENSVKLSEAVKEALQNPQAPSLSSGKATSTTQCENGKHSNDKSPSDFCDPQKCGAEKEEKVFYLIDVEHEKGPENVTQPTASSITVNGVPMTQVKTKVPIAEESDDYVYDLYYTHTRLNDIQDEAVVTVEALCNEFLLNERDGEGEDLVYDDDDDSNDEGNWRNDYPDEDPHFFENADRDYDFENDMRESNFNGNDDDEGDLLSYWMDTRCRINVDCNEFGGDYGRDDASSSDEEAGAELGYF